MTRQRVARFFEPDNRLVVIRLQKMHGSNEVIEIAYKGIARAEANGLLHERYHLVYGPEVEPAPAETEQGVAHIVIQRERRLILGNGLPPSVLQAQHCGFDKMR